MIEAAAIDDALVQEKAEFEKKYPFGKADYVSLYAEKGVRRDPRKVRDEITNLLNTRGRLGYEFAGKFEIPPEPDQAQGVVVDHGVILIFKQGSQASPPARNLV